ncbi:thermonuclease family protein [Mycoplasma hafezii]|uniref:thermonuclease family protein n=1 Tax=Mycoplasma hafezii TaxID=525886 RepID=UPI003CF436F8
MKLFKKLLTIGAPAIGAFALIPVSAEGCDPAKVDLLVPQPKTPADITVNLNDAKKFNIIVEKNYDSKTKKTSYVMYAGNDKGAQNIGESRKFNTGFRKQINEILNSQIKEKLLSAVPNLNNTNNLFLNIQPNEIPNDIQNIDIAFTAKVKYGKKISEEQPMVVRVELINLGKNLNLGVYGDKEKESIDAGYKNWTHDGFADVKQVNSSITLLYNAFFGDQAVNIRTSASYPLSAELTFSHEVNVNPTLGEFRKQVAIDPANYTHIKVDWENVSYIDGVVTGVADGDTVSVEPTKYHNVKEGSIQLNQGKLKLRLVGIDTPEKAVGDSKKSVESSPFEYQFAMLSTVYAEKTFPKGRNVRVYLSSNSDPYGRVVGDLFYGTEEGTFDVSYATEITKAGYTYPYETGQTWKKLIVLPNTYEHDVYPHIYDAFNIAIDNSRGFFHYIGNGLNIQSVVTYLYNSKKNNGWQIFWKDSGENVMKFLEKAN